MGKEFQKKMDKNDEKFNKTNEQKNAEKFRKKMVKND